MSDDKQDTSVEITEESNTVASQALVDATSAEVAPTPVSAGQLLRDARQSAGMHIATLSLALKVPVKKLEALEADDWAQLPDAVFVRALATSVCRHVKTDSAPILAALPKSSQQQLLDDRATKGLNQTYRAPTDPKPSLLRFPISMPMLLGAIGLLLAALVLIFLPDMPKRAAQQKTEVVEAMPPPSLAPAPANQVVPVVQAPPDTATPPPSVAPTTTQPIGIAPAPPTAPAPSSTPAVNTTNAPALRMVAKGVVWVEVKDAKGTLLVQRTLQPKEVVNVTGVAPLAVVVGRINEMQSVDVRGKPFSLAGLSPDNVARFEVK